MFSGFTLIMLFSGLINEISQLNKIIGYREHEIELKNKMMEAEDWCEEPSGHRYSNVHVCMDEHCRLVYWCQGWK